MAIHDEEIKKKKSIISRRKLRRIVTSLAVVVVFVTTYALILPAITLDENTADDAPGIDPGTTVEKNVGAESGKDAEGESGDGTKSSDPGEKPDPGKAEGSSSDDAAGSASGGIDGSVKGNYVEVFEEKTELTFDGKGYKVIAEVGTDAKLPADTRLKVKEIRKGTKDENGEKYDYDAYCKEALDAVRSKDGKEGKKQTRSVRLYDISFESASYDGQGDLEPAAPVKVRIVFDDAVEVSEKAQTRAVHFGYDEEKDKILTDVLKTETEKDKNKAMKEASFKSDSFSVYGVVYTVDFHYEIAGETYDFSIPGDSMIRLSEVLRMIGLGDAFEMDEIDSVEFSSPKLMSVRKTEGDWELTALKPFDTEESLTVTMDNGEQFVIAVTDSQEASSESDFDGVSKFVIWATGNDGLNYALRTDGSTAQINTSQIDELGPEYQWTITYGWHQGDNDDRYYVRPASNPAMSLTLTGNYQPPGNLVQYGSTGIRVLPQGNQTWLLEGWSWNRLNLGYNSHVFEGHNQFSTNVHITKQEDLQQYGFTVRTEELRKGYVSGKDENGAQQEDVRTYAALSKNNKTNDGPITAEPVSSGRYLFDYWDLNGERLSFGQTIPDGQLTIPYNGSTLTAHFKNNPDYVVPDEEKEGHSIDKEALDAWLEELKTREVPFNVDGCGKTAELYDYENRIYRVDLTAQSNLTMFAGDIDLGFMLDVSGSMKFPSKLDPVPGKESVDINHINDNSANQAWLNRGTTYYLISDKGSTATVYEIRWGTWTYNSGGQTRTGWGYKDASKGDSDMRYIVNSSAWSGGEVGERYPIYVDGDPPHKRLEYLESSINNTITELNNILQALSVASNHGEEPKVKIAWNTFAKPLMSTQHEFISVEGIEVRPDYTTSGGTSIDIALLDAAGKKRSDDDGNANHLVYNWSSGMYYTNTEGFGWEQNAVKFGVLITDGAPQRNGIDIDKKLVTDAADFLKAGADGQIGTDDDVKLLTVGLSMGDVKKGSVLLYDIADKDAESIPLFYKAQTGDELQYVLYEMLKQTMTDAIVESDITDTVNEAFYPVDKATGAPLEAGSVIDLEGNKIADNVSSLTPAQRKAGYGVIGSGAGGTYTVKWDNQNISSDGWHGTFYQKAREDFLGGNAVRTNAGDAVIKAESYKKDEDSAPIALKDEIVNGNGTVELTTPRVNVNELDFTSDSTEWTVYIGTEIKDLTDYLQKLYENVRIRQTIKNGTDTDGDGLKDKVVGNKDSGYYYPLRESEFDDRESEADGTPLYLKLSDIIKKINYGNDIDWDQLVALSELEGDANTGLSYTYDLYGQDNPGTITIKLTKDHDIEDHVADETGAPVETYTISVFFTPEYAHIPEGQGGDGSLDYHTGTFGLGMYGNAAGTEDSENEHKINVFEKGFRITKTDEGLDDELAGAEFDLYLTDSACTTVEQVKANAKDGYPVALTKSGGFYFTKESVAKPAAGQHYYVVEKKAPAGYVLPDRPIEVTLNITDSYTTVPGGEEAQSVPAEGPYNWTETAAVQLLVPTGSMIVDADGNEISGITADSENGMSYYKVANNPGVELPSAGGPGTTWMYILGMLLTLAGGMTFAVRRRMRA